MILHDSLHWNFNWDPLPGSGQYEAEELAKEIDSALIRWVNAGMGNVITEPVHN